jgi:SAM-dependent methyltransferase
MEQEGMVDALEEIHRLLRPASTLIEIHPAVDPPPFVEVRSNREAVLDRGMFVLDDRRRFELRTYAASVKELRDHWAFVGAYDPEEPEETLQRRRDEMYARAREVLERSRGGELVYVEPATMSRLTPSGLLER